MTPAGIKPATFRFVAQHISHCATAFPTSHVTVKVIYTTLTSLIQGLVFTTQLDKQESQVGYCAVRESWRGGAFVQPLLQWKSNKCYIFWVCVCSLTYPGCKAHAPYCHVTCPVLQYFSALSHKRHDFRKVIEHGTCVLIFSTNLSEIFLILSRTERDVVMLVLT